MDKIVIAYVADEGYEPLLRRSIASVLRYNKNVEIAVVSRTIKAIPHAKIFNIDPDVSKFKFKDNDRMKEGVYYKFWLPELPYDKIIYIDCDVLCQRPLYPLWNIDCPFICATESHSFGKKQAEMLGLKKYALTGMMVMNLKALREADFTKRCLERLAKENPQWHDETIINLEFNDRIKFIDHKFNYCKNRTYENPIHESDAYLLHYVGKANKNEMVRFNNFSNLVALKAFMRNKTVAIVGNSTEILKQNYGAEIDKHDVVIRFNRGFWWEHPKEIGTKTSIVFLACTISLAQQRKFKAKYFVGRSKQCKNNCDFRLDAMDRISFVQEVTEAVQNIEASNICQASTGFIAVNFALSTACRSIDLYGFDFLQKETYYNPKGHQTLHNGDKEAEKILEYAMWNLLRIHGCTYEAPKKKEEDMPDNEIKEETPMMRCLKIDESLIDYVAAYGIYPNQPFYSAAFKFDDLDYETKLQMKLIAYKAIKAYQAYQLDKHFSPGYKGE